MRDWGDWLVIGCIGVSILALIAMPVGFVAEANADRFSLRKDEWKCTAARSEPYIVNTIIGRAIIPMAYERTVCDQWSRVK